MSTKENSSSSSNSPDGKYYIKLLQAYVHSYLKKSIMLNSEQQNSCENYYVIDKNWITELKNYVGFDEIFEKLIERKIIYISDDDERIIEKSIKKENNNLNKDITPIDNLNLELIDSASYELIKSKFPQISIRGVDIIYGKQKIIIKLDNGSLLVKYKNNNSYDIILLDFEANKDSKDKILKDISDEYMQDWFKTIGYDNSASEYKYNLAEISLIIKKGKNSCDLFPLNDIKFNFEKAVQKVENSSYIISTMQILSIILLEHNLFENLIINSTINANNGIIHEFLIYMINLCESEKILTYVNFAKRIKKISRRKFSLREEIEPYKFYDFILNQICEEMNFKFPQKEELNKEINDMNKIKDKLDKIYNNNIIIRSFFGIFELSLECEFTHESYLKLEKFNLFNIDINDYISKEKSCEKVELEKYLRYYFTEEIKMDCKLGECKKKNDSKGHRKLVYLPDYLVIRINWGEFSEEQGFICKDQNAKIKPFYSYIDNIENIEIKKEFCKDGFVFSNNKESNGNIKYKLFGTVDYIKEQKKRFFCKFRIEGNKWFVFWWNSAGKMVGTYKDTFSSPCLLFYKKNVSS